MLMIIKSIIETRKLRGLKVVLVIMLIYKRADFTIIHLKIIIFLNFNSCRTKNVVFFFTKTMIASSIYILCLSVWVSVCLYPINVKTAEVI